MVWIGINSGKEIGIALWDTDKQQFLDKKCLPFWDSIYFFDEILDRYGVENIKVNINDRRLNKYDEAVEKIYKDTEGQHLTKLLACSKHSQNIGNSTKQTELFEEWFKINNIKIILSKPLKKTIGQKKETKQAVLEFSELTGIDKDEKILEKENFRIAAMLVFEKKK